MYAQLGDITFQNLLGFQNKDRNIGIDLSQHNRFMNKPKVQFTGVKLDTFKLDIKLHAEFCNCQEVRDELANLCTTAEILPFITGTGYLYGDFIIKSIQEKEVFALKNGEVIAMELSIELLEYYDDLTQDELLTADKSSFFALTENNPTEIESIPPAPLENRKSQDAILALNADSNKAVDQISQIQDNPSGAAKLMADSSRRIKRAKENVQKLETSIASANSSADEILAAANGYKSAAESIITSLDTGNQAQILTRVNTFKSALGILDTSLNTFKIELAKR